VTATNIKTTNALRGVKLSRKVLGVRQVLADGGEGLFRQPRLKRYHREPL
jgi:hypothetical protein